ncbi:hypothetical protein GCM10027062_06840 [Nocardioides hungaricus]
MKPDDDADDRAWRSIVENYGDRAEVEEPPPVLDAPFGDPSGFDVGLDPEFGPGPDPESDPDPEDGYVPPPPPPLPVVAPDRGLAWAGVFGSPLVLLGALLLGIAIPTWLGYALILGFVGGFLYLVVNMPREPRDPWDDGAQV